MYEIVTVPIFAIMIYVLIKLLFPDYVAPPVTAGIVNGKATYTDIAHIGGVTITLVGADGANVDSTTTGADGSYVMGTPEKGEPVGKYTIKAFKDLPTGHLEGSVEVDINAASVTAPDLTLVRVISLIMNNIIRTVKKPYILRQQ